MAKIRVNILGLKESPYGTGREVRNDDLRDVLEFDFECGETLAAILKKHGHSEIGRLGTFLRLAGGGNIRKGIYRPSDGDVIEQFVPYPF